MKISSFFRFGSVIGLIAPLLAGCSTLLERPEEVVTYRLSAPIESLSKMGAPTLDDALRIYTVVAASGFDTSRMAYSRQPQELVYYTRSRWVAPPAELLFDVFKQSFDAFNGFRTVIGPDSRLSARWGMRVELNELTHQFIQGGSVARLEIVVSLIDVSERTVVKTLTIRTSEPVTTSNARGFAQAADRAVHRAILEAVPFVYNEVARIVKEGDVKVRPVRE